MVGGFDVFKALERAQTEHGKRTPQISAAARGRRDEAAPVDGPKKVASNIGRTVMPPKHKLVCFDCGYSFEITGNVDSILCPRCRVDISLRDEKIEGEWSGDLKTGGTVVIGPDGVLKSGEIIAKEVWLDGRIEGGSIKAYHRLVIANGRSYRRDMIESPSICVAADTELDLNSAAEFKEVEVAGVLSAEELSVSELLTVRSGGLLRGRVSARRMIVETGGGLVGELAVGSVSADGDPAVDLRSES
jgi:cytoskeletal protein CcmA (bactofilin family)